MKKIKLLAVLMSVAITVTSVPMDVFATDNAQNRVESSEYSSEWEDVEDDASNADTISSANDEESNDSIKLGVGEVPELKEYHFENKNGGGIEVLVDEEGNEVKLDYSLDEDEIDCYGETKSYFNLADEGYLYKECEDQAGTGTCWAHATIGAAQSNLIKQNKITAADNYSEAHLAWFAYGAGPSDRKDPLYGDCENKGINFTEGGSYYMSQLMLSSGRGIIKESLMPDLSDWKTELDRKRLSDFENLRYESDYMLTESNFYEIEDASQRNAIKANLEENGAMAIQYYSPTSRDESKLYLNDTDDFTAYYCSNEAMKVNHGVMLVGYDDNFSADNFASKPAGDGAWICRNSWYNEDGTPWGNDGYFYISYYDKTISGATSFEMTDRNSYGDIIYQYAGSLYNMYKPTQENNSLCSGVIYTASENDIITSVGMDTSNPSTPYEIRIYKNPEDANPTSGSLASKIEGEAVNAGFHTIKLKNPVSVRKGDKFSVAVIYKKADNLVCIDHHSFNDESYVATFDTVNNTLTKWEKARKDVNVKAYTQNGFDEVDVSINSSLAEGTYNGSDELTLSCDKSDVKLYYTFDGTIPTVENGTLYEGKVSLPEATDQTVTYSMNVVAVKDGCLDSVVKSFKYTVAAGKVVLYKGQRCNLSNLLKEKTVSSNYTKIKVKSKGVSLKKKKGVYYLQAKKAGEYVVNVNLYAGKSLLGTVPVKVDNYKPYTKTRTYSKNVAYSIFTELKIPKSDSMTYEFSGRSKVGKLAFADVKEYVFGSTVKSTVKFKLKVTKDGYTKTYKLTAKFK